MITDADVLGPFWMSKWFTEKGNCMSVNMIV